MEQHNNQQNSFTPSLMDKHRGLFEPKEHAVMIWNRDKTQIVKPKYYRFILNQPLYLVDRDHAYGIISLKAPQPISIAMFKNSRERHKITDEEKSTWWGTKNKLYAYEFEFIEKFREPKKLFPHEARTIIKNVEFISDKFVSDLMEDISKYEPSKLNDLILLNDWKSVLDWHSKKKKGYKLPLTMDKIQQLAKSIFREIYNRELEYKTNEAEDRELVMEIKGMLNEELTNPFKKHQSMMDKFIDYKIINNFVSVTEDGTLQINLSKDLKKEIELKLKRMNDDINLCWHKTLTKEVVPLYHLAIIRAKPEVIPMSELDLFEPMKAFSPLKPKKDSVIFSSVDTLVKELYGVGPNV